MGKTQILGSLVNTILTDSSNNVGIGGAANASFKLQVTGATNLTGALTGTSATFSSSIQSTNIGIGFAPQSNIGAFIYRNAADYALAVQQDGSGIPFQVSSAGSVRMIITNGGNVGIGTSSPTAILETLSSYGYSIIARSTNNAMPISVVSSLGSVSTIGFKGTTSTNEYNVRVGADGNDYIAYTSNTERMRILSSGGVEIKNISSGAAGVTVSSPNSFSGGGFVHSSLTTASTSWYHLICQSGNGSTITTNNILIYGNGNVINTNNSYGPISDIKLKENIVDASPKLDDLMKVRIVNYNLKADLGYESNKQIGVIAQELEKVFPGLVDENEDIDTEGKGLGTTTKSVKMSVFVPMLIKAMQEQNKLITDLEARIKQLENK
jgi:hypothetical protein